MKITELTQQSHSEQLSEDRSKLDEVAWAPITAVAGAGLSYGALAAEYGLNPLKWPKEAYAELAADAALGATGVGLGAVAGKTAAKLGARGVKKALNTAKKNKADADADLTKVNPPAAPKTKLQRDADKFMQSKGKGPVSKPDNPAQTAAKEKVAAANADLKVAQSAYDAKVPPPSGVLGKTLKTGKAAGQSLGLGTTLNVGSDALRGKRITDPADVPYLGKDIKKDTPSAANKTLDKISLPEPDITGKSLGSQARKLRGY